jgi:hypothetical protein
MIAVLQQARQLALQEASGLFWGWSVSVVAMIWSRHVCYWWCFGEFWTLHDAGCVQAGCCSWGCHAWLGMHHYASRTQLAL